MNHNIIPIPSDRILAKEDEYLAKRDYASAERHLLYWWMEAEQGNDLRGKLLLSNELMGLYRKIQNEDKAKEYAQKALSLVDELGLSDTIGGATAFLNSGTVYKAFGEPEISLKYYEKARVIYEKELDEKDSRKAGLYNNMALALTGLSRFDEALELFHKAIEIVKTISKEDEAITWLNIADCIAAQKGMEAAENDIEDCLSKADELLDSAFENEDRGYYAFVCEKCAPVFDYYGYFVSAGKFRDRAEKIYLDNQQNEND